MPILEKIMTLAKLRLSLRDVGQLNVWVLHRRMVVVWSLGMGRDMEACHTFMLGGLVPIVLCLISTCTQNAFTAAMSDLCSHHGSPSAKVVVHSL